MAISDFITRRSFVRGASVAAASAVVAIPAGAAVPVDPKERIQLALDNLRATVSAAYPDHNIQLANTFAELEQGLGGGCILMATRERKKN